MSSKMVSNSLSRFGSAKLSNVQNVVPFAVGSVGGRINRSRPKQLITAVARKPKAASGRVPQHVVRKPVFLLNYRPQQRMGSDKN